MYKIREAFQSDCDGIGKVYCDSRKTAYQNLLPQIYLDLLTQTSHPKSGHKACINAGWDTNQLIS